MIHQVVTMPDGNLTVYALSDAFITSPGVTATRALTLSHDVAAGGLSLAAYRTLAPMGFPEVHVRFQGSSNQVDVVGPSYGITTVNATTRNAHIVWNGSIWILVSSS